MSLAIQQHFADIKECDDAVAVGVELGEPVVHRHVGDVLERVEAEAAPSLAPQRARARHISPK